MVRSFPYSFLVEVLLLLDQLNDTKSVDEFHSFLDGCEDVVYVFLNKTGQGCEPARGPSFVAAFNLVLAWVWGESYDEISVWSSPYPWKAVTEDDNATGGPEVAANIQRYVQNLRDQGLPFILCWSVKGDLKPRLDSNLDPGAESHFSVRDQLVHYLQHELCLTIT